MGQRVRQREVRRQGRTQGVDVAAEVADGRSMQSANALLRQLPHMLRDMDDRRERDHVLTTYRVSSTLLPRHLHPKSNARVAFTELLVLVTLQHASVYSKEQYP